MTIDHAEAEKLMILYEGRKGLGDTPHEAMIAALEVHGPGTLDRDRVRDELCYWFPEAVAARIERAADAIVSGELSVQDASEPDSHDELVATYDDREQAERDHDAVNAMRQAGLTVEIDRQEHRTVVHVQGDCADENTDDEGRYWTSVEAGKGTLSYERDRRLDR